MGLLSCREMKELEERVFATGVRAEALMDKAGERFARMLLRRFPRAGTAVAYCGRGNNGGDALVALRVLREAGWEVRARLSHPLHECGPLPRRKFSQVPWLSTERRPMDPSDLQPPLVLIDGLLGIGARGPLREPLATLAAEMNRLRSEVGARVVSVDIPSGVDGDTGEVYDGAVVADVTAAIAVMKPGLLADGVINHVGALEVIRLAELPEPENGDEVITPSWLCRAMPPRLFETHKGMAGRVGLLAGSRGLLGAALLAAQGALRGGGGLVTLFVAEELYPLVLSLAPPPELMVKAVRSYEEVLEARHDALGIGPGLGGLPEQGQGELLEVLRNFDGPMVIDADALNFLAEGRMNHLRPEMILTPHPGEMARLFPESGGWTRARRAREFVGRYPGTLLLKGARTIVGQRDCPLAYNTTGTPAMGSGGQGDVLTGLLAALLAGGLPPREAAGAGAWLAGRASELALQNGLFSEQSLLASDTAGWLGAAFEQLRTSC